MEEVQYETTEAWVKAALDLREQGEDIWPADEPTRRMFGFTGGGKHHLIHIPKALATPLSGGRQPLLSDLDGRRKLLLGG